MHQPEISANPAATARSFSAGAAPAPATGGALGRGRRPATRMLHVLNGDTAADRLRAAGIAGEITLSADLLYEGPLTAESSPEGWRHMRARFLAESGYGDYETCLAALTGWDRSLAAFRAHDEVVLWFEHDLFDQLHLCRLLAWFAGRDAGLTELSLVQAGDYLGRMPPLHLSGLLDTRQPVSDTQKRQGSAAWDAFCAPVPTFVEALSRADITALPHLAPALRRHLEEYPGLSCGLSRTERQALAAVARGPLPFASLFAAVQRQEERVFMTDLSLLRRLRELASGPRPLLRLEAPSTWPADAASADRSAPASQIVAITGTGLAVVDGGEDWIEIRGGIDRWLGGVHLAGRDAAWRWDDQGGRLVAAKP
jgi:hypothetical protein